MKITMIIQRLLAVMMVVAYLAGSVQCGHAQEPIDEKGPNQIFLPTVMSAWDALSWSQIGGNPQRTNYTSMEVAPPYCYTWKWVEAPFASRVQPVVAGGMLYIGSMNGVIYARNSKTGAPIWSVTTGGPIRHSGAVGSGVVVFSSYDGYAYGLSPQTGAQIWKVYTGASATAPLYDPAAGRMYIATVMGKLYALSASTGNQIWSYDAAAPILTTPSLSADGQTIFLGTEKIQAIAVRASNGTEKWRTTLQGQSLAERYPVVVGNSVIYRSQPNFNFNELLREGDYVMDGTYNGGTYQPVNANWATDWTGVRTRIVNYLQAQAAKQTFFVLDANTGTSKGITPVLYTYGNNDIPNVPVSAPDGLYVTYRARHGIQTDSGTVHVSSAYDAELGKMNLSNLDITGLPFVQMSGQLQFRMTSDEPAMLTKGGNILLVDNWERLGGINTVSNSLVHVGAVSNDWPECYVQCGPGTTNPFFPLTGSGSAYPFPGPRVTEGHSRGGAVIADNMIYWLVIESGLAGISHKSGSSCPAPYIWQGTTGFDETPQAEISIYPDGAIQRNLADYVTLDLTTPNPNPPADLVTEVRSQVRAIVNSGNHLMPIFFQRGMTSSNVWPYNTTQPCSPTPCLPQITYGGIGNAYWHDPGEFLYTLALVYPYLEPQLKNDLKTYVAAEMNRYPPLQDLPWGENNWLKQGVTRELYDVPFRSSLNNWPPPAANISALYGLWLWSKNTGDWSYAQSHWSQAQTLFNARKGQMLYYADIAGAIGYARMAAHFGYTPDFNAGVNAAVSGMTAGLSFSTFQQRAESQYLDPRNQQTGLSAPVFFGMTPEVGLYLRENFSGGPQNYLLAKESGNNLRWWWLTRVGLHGEIGESSFLSPFVAWSHFLGHAYIIGDNQATLMKWLDRPWALGDLYYLQKLVATIQAAP